MGRYLWGCLALFILILHINYAVAQTGTFGNANWAVQPNPNNYYVLVPRTGVLNSDPFGASGSAPALPLSMPPSFMEDARGSSARNYNNAATILMMQQAQMLRAQQEQMAANQALAIRQQRFNEFSQAAKAEIDKEISGILSNPSWKTGDARFRQRWIQSIEDKYSRDDSGHLSSML